MKKAIFVSEECHRKLKIVAAQENMEMGEWAEWAIGMAHQAKERGAPTPSATAPAL